MSVLLVIKSTVDQPPLKGDTSMRAWIKVFVFVGLVLSISPGCGKDDKSSAERDAELKKALQEGMQKEKKMYEGTQKQMEDLEKAMKEQKEKSK
jgi:hypothetical protein